MLSDRPHFNNLFYPVPVSPKVYRYKQKWFHAMAKIKSTNQQIMDHQPRSHLIVGARQRHDHLVREDRFIVPASCFGRKVTYEHTFRAPTNFEVTLVIAVNREVDDGAVVNVVEGGKGHDSVTLRFKSRRFKGIHFHVQVYAKAKC